MFVANIDTPGEQHHYIVVLLEEVLSLLPPEATVRQAYDIGCIIDRSIHRVSSLNPSGAQELKLQQFNILRPEVQKRVSFVLNAMHAYGHEWGCQLLYNPRMVKGMGLTDSEGIERLWSRIRKLIPITRGQWVSGAATRILSPLIISNLGVSTDLDFGSVHGICERRWLRQSRRLDLPATDKECPTSPPISVGGCSALRNSYF